LTRGLSASQLERVRDWDRLIQVRGDVLKALEVARNEKRLGSSLEARLLLAADAEWKPLLDRYCAELPMLLIVSQVELSSQPAPELPSFGLPGIRLAIRHALGEKCERCWNYSPRVGENEQYPTVCERCLAALTELSLSQPVPGTAD